MRRPLALGRVAPGNLLLVSDAQAVINFTGQLLIDSTPVSGDPALGLLPNTQDVVFPANTQTFPRGDPFTLPAGKWVVIQYLAKRLAGDPIGININGQAGRFSAASIRDSAWRTYTAIAFNKDETPNERLFHYGPSSGPSTVRVGGYAITTWDSYEDALAWANSGLFPMRPLDAFAVQNVTTTKTVDGNSGKLTASATYTPDQVQSLSDALVSVTSALGTLISDLKVRGIV